ncbi:MAG: acrB [Myxococcales bacterium]|nr:acrB [Myxococcales bacterium]
MWLTRLALRNPILILMISIGACVLGGTAVSRLPVDLFPSISPPLVQIATFYPGASPGDVEKTITYPIEKAVSSVSDVEHVESTSKQGASIVRVWFNWGGNLDVGEIEIIERLQQVLASLPPGVQQPYVLKIDLSNIPVSIVTVTSVGKGGPDERDLRDLAFNNIEPQLEHLPHVASADVSGGKTRQINVVLDREALKSRGLGVQDVVRAVQSSNLLLPSGTLRAGSRNYNLFTNTQFVDVRPMNDIVVKLSPSGEAVHIGDIGHVEDSAQDQSDMVRILTRHEVDDPDHPGQKKLVLQGGRGVQMRILKQPGANTVGVVDALKKLLPNLRGIPDSVRTGVFFDQSTYVRASLSSLREEALTGSILAILVILLFLRSARSTIIIAVAIPLSIVVTFILLYFLGQSLNVFTLGGLALGVGRLVDDSIVELENIQRHLNEGKPREQAALEAAQEVALPILVSTITTIVVFFPVVFLVGIPKLLFIPLTLTIAFSLICSFFVSRTVTPILCVRLLKREGGYDLATPKGRFLAKMERFIDGIDERYERILHWALHHRRTIILTTIGAFILSCFSLRFIGKDFIPDTDESQFSASIKAPVGTRVEETEKVVKRVEETIAEAIGVDMIQSVVSSVGIPQGRSGIFSQNTGPHAANVQVNLVQPGERKLSDVQLMEKVRKVAGDGRFAGVAVYFQSGGIVKRILNFGSQAPIDVEVTGYDLKNAREVSRKVADAMRGIEGLTDVQISREENYPELDVVVDREKASKLGFSQTEIANTILTSMSGDQNTPSMYTDPTTGNEYFIIVRLHDRWRSNVRDLHEVFLPAKNGGAPVALSTFARIERSSGPVLIDRKYQERVVHVYGNVLGRDLGGITDDVEKALASIPLPPGFKFNLSGQSQTQKEAFQSLLFAAGLALMLVYMVMASQFRSLLDPLIIMFSVPMGLIGVFLSLLITHTSLSVNSFMGIIMMVGIVVSNGVLLIDYTRVLREGGVPLEEAVIRAGRTRLRPILMTTLATVLGLMPMALGLGVGSETNLPLARAVIGGLTVSTALTLLLVPSLYVAMESRLEKRRARKAA